MNKMTRLRRYGSITATTVFVVIIGCAIVALAGCRKEFVNCRNNQAMYDSLKNAGAANAWRWNV